MPEGELMFDFGALPPEINSARMYAGPGSGPMMAAAAAWDGLTAQLEVFAARYSAVVSELHGHSWSGASSSAMAAASAPYVAWLTTTAQQSGQAANQARAAAAAYEAAFIATVPPAVVAANRALLTTLVVTNFFGQNTPAIAATEAAYAEMWAQDAAAMYTYAGSASSAASLTQFSPPPPTTSPAAQTVQGVSQASASSIERSGAALPQLMSALPQQLQSLASGGATNAAAADTPASSIVTIFSDINTLTGPLIPAYQFPFATFQMGIFIQGLLQSSTQAKDLPAMMAPLSAAASTSQTIAPQGISEPVLASAGRASAIGGLSTPPNWAAATSGAVPAGAPVSAVETRFRVLPPWVEQPASTNHSGPPPMAQINNPGPRRGDNTVFRMRDRRYRMPRPAPGG
jgi:PPE-repeat protein